ncbi:hypothetical protein JW960_04710 [candidate division KSB1 bacterium]|nr:hypothetical protein [candidate division KSB1 bacterium]
MSKCMYSHPGLSPCPKHTIHVVRCLSLSRQNGATSVQESTSTGSVDD